MGLFHNRKSEETYEEDGYIIGVVSHKIYHAPVGRSEYVLPSSAVSIDQTAINDMNSSAIKIIIPGSFKKFGGIFLKFAKLKKVVLMSGVEEVECLMKDAEVDFELPNTIKKIAKNNYPITKKLVIPNGVTEIGNSFASHDSYLEYVEIPGTIKSLPSFAFNQCKNLQVAILKECVESAALNTFSRANKLSLVSLPSTFNGSLLFDMDFRPVFNGRGNSSYTPDESELDRTIRVLLKRGEKSFEFRFRRGDCPSIAVLGNMVDLKTEGQPSISIDCNTLQEGVYDIKNGQITPVKIDSTFTQQQELDPSSKARPYINSKVKEKLVLGQPKEPVKIEEAENLLDKYYDIFQANYKEHIIPRDDFKSLPGNIKSQVRGVMQRLFVENIRRTGKVNEGYDVFDFYFNKALKEVMSQFSDDSAFRHQQELTQSKARPYINLTVKEKLMLLREMVNGNQNQIVDNNQTEQTEDFGMHM